MEVLSATASAIARKPVLQGIQTMSLVIPPALADAIAAGSTCRCAVRSSFPEQGDQPETPFRLEASKRVMSGSFTCRRGRGTAAGARAVHRTRYQNRSRRGGERPDDRRDGGAIPRERTKEDQQPSTRGHHGSTIPSDQEPMQTFSQLLQ